MDCLEYSIPICSTLLIFSPSSRIPAVSIKVTGIPKSRVSFNTSRVVPAISVTMALSKSKSALNKDDLPTLGFPTIATETPCLKMFEVCAFDKTLSILPIVFWNCSIRYEYSGSATSSGKSIPAVILDKTSKISFLICLIWITKLDLLIQFRPLTYVGLISEKLRMIRLTLK